MTNWKQGAAMLAVGSLAALPLAACSGSNSNNGSSGKTLVVDNQFDLQTLDPARAFEFTDVMLDHQLYDTALTYVGSDTSKLIPELTTYTISNDNKVVTLKLNGKHKFADGKTVTSDDIVFSYQRLEGIKGNPSYLLNDPANKPIVVKQLNSSTVTLTSSVSNPALPSILPNPALSVLQKKALLAHGGTTTTKDGAQQYLNSHSLGTTAYQIESSNITSRVALNLNPGYTGKKPAYSKIIFRNVEPATQRIDIQSGSTQIALDVDPASAEKLVKSSKISQVAGPSLNTVYAWFNVVPKYGGPASRNEFVKAVRHAINYKAIAQLAGPGSTQPGGVVPEGIEGALKSDPNNSYDPNLAKAELAKSGYSGQAISMLVDSQASVGNASFVSIAQSIQAELAKVGITLKLVPQPSVTALTTFRSGTFQAGIGNWGADFPDPSDYIAFAPSQNVGARAGWNVGKNIASAEAIMPAFNKAMTTTNISQRVAAWQAVQKQMNQDGPFIPFLQPGKNIVFSSVLKNVSINPIWTTQFDDIK